LTGVRMSRGLPALATAALLLSAVSTPRAGAPPVDVAAIVGSWRLEDAAPDPGQFRQIAREAHGR
jgi:hypothetical protein